MPKKRHIGDKEPDPPAIRPQMDHHAPWEAQMDRLRYDRPGGELDRLEDRRAFLCDGGRRQGERLMDILSGRK